MRFGRGFCKELGGSEFVAPGMVIRALVLKILSDGELHGYEIFSKLEEFFPESTLFKNFAFKGLGYRILRAMEFEGLIESRWVVGEGPARRVYKITDKGLESIEYFKKYLSYARDWIEKVLYFIKGGNSDG